MTKTYTTVQGDMWDSIAYAQMGDTAYTHQLIAANLQYQKYYTFPAGIVLTIPEIIRPAGTNTLPPWKKVSV